MSSTLKTPKVTELLIEGWNYLDSEDYPRLLDEMGISYNAEDNDDIDKKIDELYTKYEYLDEELTDYDLEKGIEWRTYYFKYENKIYGVECSFDSGWNEYEITREPFEVESYQETVTKYKEKYE